MCFHIDKFIFRLLQVLFDAIFIEISLKLCKRRLATWRVRYTYRFQISNASVMRWDSNRLNETVNSKKKIRTIAKCLSLTWAMLQAQARIVIKQHRKWFRKQFNILSITITHNKHLDLLVWPPLQRFGRANTRHAKCHDAHTRPKLMRSTTFRCHSIQSALAKALNNISSPSEQHTIHNLACYRTLLYDRGHTGKMMWVKWTFGLDRRHSEAGEFVNHLL